MYDGLTGFQLGENHQYSKVTNWEHSLRIPLMIKPRTSDNNTSTDSRSASVAGASSTLLRWGAVGRLATGFVEAVDLFPTIVELAMPAAVVPRCASDMVSSRATRLCTDGTSIVAALHDPAVSLRPAAFSQVPRNALVQGMQGGHVAATLGERFMGYTIRSEDWRYTEYFPFDPGSGLANWTIGSTVGVELYRHSPGDEEVRCTWEYEIENVAGVPKLVGVVAQMAEALRAGMSSPSTPRG